MNAPPDPGWPAFGPALFPGGLQWYLKRHGDDDQRRVLRALWLSYVEADVLFAVIAVAITAGRSSAGTLGPLLLAATALVAVGMRLVGLTRRPLDCASDATLLTSYRSRFFLRTAFAESVVLIGFATTMRGDGAWLVVVGAVVALALMAVDAPTRANLERDDAALRRGGCGRSLVVALSGGNGPPGPA
jgi:hypothetical protein